MKGNKHFINEYDMHDDVLRFIGNKKSISPSTEILPDVPGHAVVIEDFLTRSEVDAIVIDTDKHSWIPVGLDGILSHYKEGDPVGSYRLSCYEPELAEILWKRLAPHLPAERHLDDYSHTDTDNHIHWKPVGVNPLFRFIKYIRDGALVPHYDGPFIESDTTRSLTTLVMYLTNNDNGGTRFLHDSQDNVPHASRNFDDWTREAKESEIAFKIDPRKGKALVFDHRILHDSEPMGSDATTKIIIRADIMYEKVYK